MGISLFTGTVAAWPAVWERLAAVWVGHRTAAATGEKWNVAQRTEGTLDRDLYLAGGTDHGAHPIGQGGAHARSAIAVLFARAGLRGGFVADAVAGLHGHWLAGAVTAQSAWRGTEIDPAGAAQGVA